MRRSATPTPRDARSFSRASLQAWSVAVPQAGGLVGQPLHPADLLGQGVGRNQLFCGKGVRGRGHRADRDLEKGRKGNG
jgi:hypothetical protein